MVLSISVQERREPDKDDALDGQETKLGAEGIPILRAAHTDDDTGEPLLVNLQPAQDIATGVGSGRTDVTRREVEGIQHLSGGHFDSVVRRGRRGRDLRHQALKRHL